MFRVGDEVICIDATTRTDRDRPPVAGRLAKGHTYTIAFVGTHGGEVGVNLSEVQSLHETGMFLASRFRKVERKSDSLSIEAFRTIKDGAYEEPRRTNQPAKRKEQA